MNTPEGWKLDPCPFCGGEAEFERVGTPRQSCIVTCRNCGARHESSDENERSGMSWNSRAAADHAPPEQPVYGSISERAEAGLAAGLWKPAPQGESYLSGVNVEALLRACAELGLSAEHSLEALAAPDVLAEHINRVSRAVIATARKRQQPEPSCGWAGCSHGAECVHAKQPEPGGLVDRGPWNVTEAGNLQSDDFTHDVTLQISGDFENKAQRIAYAEALCGALNSTTRKRSDEEVARIMEAVQFYGDQRAIDAYCRGFNEPDDPSGKTLAALSEVERLLKGEA